ncbi:MAG: HRDC domain-containing protein [Burkholderiales bacterium]|nr:HRDC domain-containing protein [Phycisphaerae bacterium]
MSRGQSDFRSRHRQRAHDEAHADSGPPHDARIPEHLQAARGQVELIDSAAALDDLIAQLRAAGSFAYDSEFIGESSYHPKLCLIQVATAEQIWLIDPLAKLDINPFWRLLADASVEKIVHAGAQDVEPVCRLFGEPARNIFDTQIAAGFVAMAYPTSLAKLVLELTGVALHKGLTFTYWDQRPLSAKQMRYAADDVRYLPAVTIELKKRLERTGHLAWVMTECNAICDPALYRFTPEVALEKVRGSGTLEPRQLNVLKELVVWRDTATRAADLPARSYLKDEVLIDLSRNGPKNRDQLGRIRGMPRPLIDAEGDTLIALVTKGLAASTDGVEVLRGVESTPTERFAADALWTAAQAICISQSIDPAAVTSRTEIGELHRHLIDNTDPSDLRVMKTWRGEALGNKLLAVYRGESVVSISLPK